MHDEAPLLLGHVCMPPTQSRPASAGTWRATGSAEQCCNPMHHARAAHRPPKHDLPMCRSRRFSTHSYHTRGSQACKAERILTPRPPRAGCSPSYSTALRVRGRVQPRPMLNCALRRTVAEFIQTGVFAAAAAEIDGKSEGSNENRPTEDRLTTAQNVDSDDINGMIGTGEQNTI